MDVSKIFSKKNWKDRVVEFPGRRRIRDVATGEEKVIDVSRNEGTILQEGDLYNALNMNDLERRAEEAFAALGEYVADGKSLIASAITSKGVATAADAEFAIMAENVGKIKTTPKVTSQGFSGAKQGVTIWARAGRTLWVNMFIYFKNMYYPNDQGIPGGTGSTFAISYNSSNGALVISHKRDDMDVRYGTVNGVIYYID